MKKFTTIDVNELYKIDGGERCDLGEAMMGVAGKISKWFKGLFD